VAVGGGVSTPIGVVSPQHSLKGARFLGAVELNTLVGEARSDALCLVNSSGIKHQVRKMPLPRISTLTLNRKNPEKEAEPGGPCPLIFKAAPRMRCSS
jgi:hypothetical protein